MNEYLLRKKKKVFPLIIVKKLEPKYTVTNYLQTQVLTTHYLSQVDKLTTNTHLYEKMYQEIITAWNVFI